MQELVELTELIRPQEQPYFTRKWRRYFDKWIPWLQEQSGSQVHPVQDNMGYIYAGDLEGYLARMGIDDRYHWVVMRMNGMQSFSDFDETRQILVIPNFGLVDQIMANMEIENQNDDDVDSEW